MENNGIPLYFQCFKGKHENGSCQFEVIKKGIEYVHNLLKNKKCKLIFLGDRGFLSCKIMEYIEELGDIYCIRAKSNVSIYIYNYDKIAGSLKEVTPKEKEEQHYEGVLLTKKKYVTNLAVSKTEGHKEPFYIVTNGEVRKAVRNYKYRFGSIEFVFKNQKSNGFYLESTKMRNLQSFTTMFGVMCVALLWLTLIGIDYSKKQRKGKEEVKIRCYRKEERLFSLFNTGLIYFNIAYNSNKKLKIECSFLLYDIYN